MHAHLYICVYMSVLACENRRSILGVLQVLATLTFEAESLPET